MPKAPLAARLPTKASPLGKGRETLALHPLYLAYADLNGTGTIGPPIPPFLNAPP